MLKLQESILIAEKVQRVSGKTCPDVVMVKDQEFQEGEPVAADLPLQWLR